MWHFREIARITVVHVWRVGVKAKRLGELPHATLQPWSEPPVLPHRRRKRRQAPVPPCNGDEETEVRTIRIEQVQGVYLQ